VPALSERGVAGFQFTLMTDDPELAGAADEAGIDRVGLDLERLGKYERQGALPHLRISDHRVEQLPRLRSRLERAQAFVRVNPLNPGSAGEIELALDAGAEVLMLPYFRTPGEVETFVELVRGRAFVSLLLETGAAAEDVAAIARVRGVDEIMVGLNDLALDLGFSNQFALLVSPVLERIAEHVRGAGLPFGCGGIADPANDALPVPPSLVCAQYPRLGATRAFVARAFTAAGLQPGGLKQGVLRCRAELVRWQACSPEELELARDGLAVAAGALAIDQARAPSATSLSLRSRPGNEWCSRIRSPSASEIATRSSSFPR
jgi:HpcH/HpaI aldolase/citrate lyase family